MSMFYGALEEATALAETYVRHDGRPAEATIAVFELVEDLNVINLTALPEYPSVFGSDEGNLDRPGVHFLHSFARDFVQAVDKDGREHVEYVPSQIVTEYIRYRLADKAGKLIKGILYPSARTERGTGCVLFVVHEDISGMFRSEQAPFKLLPELTRMVRVDTSPSI
jgi:RES domain-containing protein